MGILVVAEIYKGCIHRVGYELLGKGRELADGMNTALECLVIDDGKADISALRRRGADKIYRIIGDCFSIPEEYLYKLNLVEFLKEYRHDVVLFGATNFGRSLAPRVAAALKTGLTADCTDLQINEAKALVQIRPAFSDNILAHIKTVTMPQIATIRHQEFTEADETERVTDVLELPAYGDSYDKCKVLGLSPDVFENISEAPVIVAGGRGIKEFRDIALLEGLARKLGGVVGFSRALVDAGMANASYQIGYSGRRVKPRLYIACGISGAPQHIAGMKESGTVIAINTDASAPIFKFCDIGYVGNLYEIVPKLIEEWGDGR